MGVSRVAGDGRDLYRFQSQRLDSYRKLNIPQTSSSNGLLEENGQRIHT